VDTGNFEAAMQAVEEALKTNVVEGFDPRIQRLAREIEDGKLRIEQKTSATEILAAPVDESTLAREYAFLEAPPMPIEQPPVETSAAPQASVTQLPVTPSPSVPVLALPNPPREIVLPGPETVVEPPLAEVKPAEVKPAGTNPAKTNSDAEVQEAPIAEVPDMPVAEVQEAPLAEVEEAPVAPRVQVEIPKSGPAVERPAAVIPAPPSLRGAPVWRKPAALAGVAALLAAAAVWSAIYFKPSKAGKTTETPPAVSTKPESHAPVPNPLEQQQQKALDSANEMVAANDLNGAKQVLQQAAALNGPLTPEILKKESEIDASMKDATVRQLRQSEEKVWQRAMKRTADGNFAEAQKDLRQVLAMPAGGVRKSDAQNYLDQVIPQRIAENSLLSQARQALKGSDFQSARQAASQLKKSGGDPSVVVAEIDQQEQTKLGQLTSQFEQIKQRDDDAAVQQLKGLQPKFQVLAGDGGPQAGEASNYANAVPGAITEIQARMQKKNTDAAFQRTVQKYQQALNAKDKNGLTSARNEFQAVIQSGGPHAEEAQRYRSDIDNTIAALSAPPVVSAPPAIVKNDAPDLAAANDSELRAVIKRYAQAFENRDPDALRQVWPGIGSKYSRYKQIFDLASAIREEVNIQSVTVSPDGKTAQVRSSVFQSYTPKAEKNKPQQFTHDFVFELEKSSRGTWVIRDVQ
jgi:hypothetical protein